MEFSEMTTESLKYAQLDINKIIERMDHFVIPLKAVNEGNTCNQFVLPFFKAFGWGSDYTYWSTEYRIPNTNKHVDYAFSTNGHGWAYVEAKRIRYKNIDKNKNFTKQVTGYFNAAPCAHLIILTNGEEYCFYSYGDDVEIRTIPFIKFNIHDIDLTGNATFLRHLFIRNFHIGDWPKYAEMSRALAEIQHALRRAPDTLGKQNLIQKSFALLYPGLSEEEQDEALQFFTQFGQKYPTAFGGA